ncbi:type II toxin-antitoxin system VapC family toxin [Brevundimonas sp.]|uniref:type II toxin-antitoxin system VapC family toxin n=1 Tax=Brevundimonas sp. TaxID=1871086 RepID=UPI002AB80970|nr:type II toxin-antitoxin system VapC family toxin [Brevundimonas sp.]MDZ4365140.1 type II toxin-antitoxin system VapC family toxin [Brevundimonas sp.]
MTAKSVLLDTNAIIRIQLDWPIRAETAAIVDASLKSGQAWISVVSAWEIAMLSRNNQSRSGRLFAGDPQGWFDRVLEASGVRLAAVGHRAAMASCLLPGWAHRDPGDRLLVAQARDLDAVLVTRDQAILDYAALGHVRALAC